jgi:hypothetical protein
MNASLLLLDKDGSRVNPDQSLDGENHRAQTRPRWQRPLLRPWQMTQMVGETKREKQRTIDLFQSV